jgi:hypothetical protein
METQSELIKPTPVFIWTMRLAGSFLAFIVVFLYAKGIQGGYWPPGHPWSGIAESCIAFSLFMSSYSGSRPKIAGFCFAFFGMISAILWFASSRQ